MQDGWDYNIILYAGLARLYGVRRDLYEKGQIVRHEFYVKGTKDCWKPEADDGTTMFFNAAQRVYTQLMRNQSPSIDIGTIVNPNTGIVIQDINTHNRSSGSRAQAEETSIDLSYKGIMSMCIKFATCVIQFEEYSSADVVRQAKQLIKESQYHDK